MDIEKYFNTEMSRVDSEFWARYSVSILENL